MTDFKLCDIYFKQTCPGELPFKVDAYIDDILVWDAELRTVDLGLHASLFMVFLGFLVTL